MFFYATMLLWFIILLTAIFLTSFIYILSILLVCHTISMYLIDTLTKKKISIIYLQETKWTEKKLRKLTALDMYYCR